MKRWVWWLIIWLAASIGGQALAWWPAWLGTPGLGLTLAWLALPGGTLWLLWGLFCWRGRRWVRTIAGPLAGTYAAAGAAALFSCAGHPATTLAVLGVWAMTLAFFLGLILLRGLLAPGHPVTGIARTLIDEAVRMKIAVIFVALLVLLVPFIPLGLDPADPLQYRMQTYLNLSLTLVEVVLSLMTVAVACWTICGEVAGKQVHLTLTKPVARWQYLLGKWLGLACLNLLLLTVTGLGVYACARVLDAQPAHDAADRTAVEHQVLTARQGLTPLPPNPDALVQQAEKRFEDLRREFPERYPQTRFAQLDPRDRKAIENAVLDQWHTIPANDYSLFVFHGLTPPVPGMAASAPPLKLRLQPRMSLHTPDGLIHLALQANGYWLGNATGDSPAFTVIEKGTLEVDVPVVAVNPGGELTIAVVNPLVNSIDPQNPASMTFTPGQGIKLFRESGAFAPNLARALGVIWARLLFLATLGLAAAAFLSFPVACLAALVVTTIAYASGFIDEALVYFATLPDTNQPWPALIVHTAQTIFQAFAAGKFGDGLKMIIKLFLMGLMTVTPSLARNDPVSAITGGELVSFPVLGLTLLKVGLLGSGVCGLAAWLIFRRRELARIIV
jgi:hypothetical protein